MIRALAPFALLSLLLGCGEPPVREPEPARQATAENAVAPAPKASPPVPEADVVRVALNTEKGEIVIALDARRAPVTTRNFLAYVDQHRLDGTTFYRAAPTRGATGRGFIQGGIRRNYRRMLPPIAHEPTSATGLRHVDGAISMARTEPGTATGEFFITVGAMPSMDAHGGDQGFAAFGRVVGGMAVVRRILAAPTVPNAGRGAMRGQMIAEPVRIVTARRAD